MPRHIATARGDQGLLCGAQEKVLHEFVVGIGHLKMWIVALHAYLPVVPDGISHMSENPQF